MGTDNMDSYNPKLLMVYYVWQNIKRRNVESVFKKDIWGSKERRYHRGKLLFMSGRITLGLCCFPAQPGIYSLKHVL